jgi:hypothetical protein
VNYRKSPDRPLRTGEPRRTFTDQEGNFWDVREVKVSDYDRRGGRSLLFESIGAIRRVRDFPDNWLELSEEELEAISKRR